MLFLPISRIKKGVIVRFGLTLLMPKLTMGHQMRPIHVSHDPWSSATVFCLHMPTLCSTDKYTTQNFKLNNSLLACSDKAKTDIGPNRGNATSH